MLEHIYKELFTYYGAQGWWPAKTAFEVIVGAILTQHTAWRNVEKAIVQLKERGLLEPEAMWASSPQVLAECVRPAGFYRVKEQRLRAFCELLHEQCSGSLKALFAQPATQLRQTLLNIKGIGPETADCIVLYAAHKPIFVIDAYTKRILTRHNYVAESADYHEMQSLCMNTIPHNVEKYQEFHALLVQVGKDFCRPKAQCSQCPLNKLQSKITVNSLQSK